jgi:hypothetical protein
MTNSNNLDQEIQSRIQSFLAELSGLVKRQALEAVHEALSGSAMAPARRGPGRPRGSTTAKRGPGRPPKVSGPARSGKRAKRTSEAVEAMAARVLAQVRSKPGQRLEEIGRAMKMPTKGLKLPIQKLLAGKQVRTEGQKRGTKYFAGGGGGGAQKAAGSRKSRGGRKGKRGRKL